MISHCKVVVFTEEGGVVLVGFSYANCVYWIDRLRDIANYGMVLIRTKN